MVLIALLISVLAMAMQHVEMERERSELGIP
jgi:hypothetical protein